MRTIPGLIKGCTLALLVVWIGPPHSSDAPLLEAPFVSELQIVQNGEVRYHAVWETGCPAGVTARSCVGPLIFGRFLRVLVLQDLLPEQSGEIRLRLQRGENPPDSAPDISELQITANPVDAFVRVGPPRMRAGWIVAHVGVFNKPGRIHVSIGPADSVSISRTQRAIEVATAAKSLDAHPGTVARLDTTDTGIIHWRSYERGIDRHHPIRVAMVDPEPQDTILANEADREGPEPSGPELPPASDGVCGPYGNWSGTVSGAAGGNWRGDFAVFFGDYPRAFSLIALERTNPSAPMPPKLVWINLWSLWSGSSPNAAIIYGGFTTPTVWAAILQNAVAPGRLSVRVSDSTAKTMSGTVSLSARLVPKTRDQQIEVVRTGSMAGRPAVQLEASFCAVRVKGQPPPGPGSTEQKPKDKGKCADEQQAFNDAEAQMESRQEHMRSLIPNIKELHSEAAALNAGTEELIGKAFTELQWIGAQMFAKMIVDRLLAEEAVLFVFGPAGEAADGVLFTYHLAHDILEASETASNLSLISPETPPEEILRVAEEKGYANAAKLAQHLIAKQFGEARIFNALLQYISVWEGRTTTVAQGKSFERLIRERDEAKARLAACLSKE